MTPVAAAVADAYRREWSRVLAATVRLTRDLDLAEECTQDAYAQAVRTWPATGVPDRPGVWLTTAARRRALDELPGDTTFRRRMPLLVTEPAETGPDTGPAEDDRLRLIFTCCHPALSRDAQVALTLRLVCGLSPAEVARALLVPEPTVAGRLTRAKKKIAAARIPYRVPFPDQLGDRTGAVLDVVHLIFTTGHTAPDGAAPVRRHLSGTAIGLARLLHLLMPADGEVTALLALLLFAEARAATRTSAEGRLQLLPGPEPNSCGRCPGGPRPPTPTPRPWRGPRTLPSATSSPSAGLRCKPGRTTSPNPPDVPGGRILRRTPS